MVRSRMSTSNVFYYRCPYHRLRLVLTMALSFDIEDDIYQLALSYPYSYSRYKSRLNFYQVLTSKTNERSSYKYLSHTQRINQNSRRSNIVKRRSVAASTTSAVASKSASAVQFASGAKTFRTIVNQRRQAQVKDSSGRNNNDNDDEDDDDEFQRQLSSNSSINENNIHQVKRVQQQEQSKRVKTLPSVKIEEDTGICFRRDRLSMRSLVSVAYVFSTHFSHACMQSSLSFFFRVD